MITDNSNLLGKSAIDRRDFLTLSTKVITAQGLSTVLIPRLASAMEKGEKLAVIWLHFQECTGCTESLLRAEGPDLATLFPDTISLEYHETLFATGEDGKYCMFRRKTGF